MANERFQNAMDAIDQMIAGQKAQATQAPTGIFGNVDPVMLGLARGFLSPTRSGGFGESIGLGLAGAEGPLSAMKKQQLDAQNKMQELQLAKAKLLMEEPYYAARADRYGMYGGDTLSAQSTAINRALTALEARSPEDLGMTDEEYNENVRNLTKRLIDLSAREAKTAGKSGEAAGPIDTSGSIPRILDSGPAGEAAVRSLPPDTEFIAPDGTRKRTPKAPANQPRG